MDQYFADGVERLGTNAAQVRDVSAQLLDVLDDAEGQQAVKTLEGKWTGWSELKATHTAYQKAQANDTTIEAHNQAQHELQAQFEPFFAELRAGLKTLDKLVRGYEKKEREANGRRGIGQDLKALKDALETLREEVRDAEACFGHIHWLQERFPAAKYEDVTGLCKLATLDEIKEQDYSLNPGRYVGVVIEEDGKTEEEFIEELLGIQEELDTLNLAAKTLENVIGHNLKQLAGDE